MPRGIEGSGARGEEVNAKGMEGMDAGGTDAKHSPVDMLLLSGWRSTSGCKGSRAE